MNGVLIVSAPKNWQKIEDTIKKIPVTEEDDENIPIVRTSTQQPMFETKDTEMKVEVDTVKEAAIEENVDINQNDHLQTDKGAEASDV